MRVGGEEKDVEEEYDPALDDEEGEGEEVELGDELDYAGLSLGGSVAGASTNYKGQDGVLERNLLLTEEERRELTEGKKDTAFVFDPDDNDQMLLLILAEPRSPTRIGADFAVPPDPRAVHETFSVAVSSDGEEFYDWGKFDLSEEGSAVTSPVFLPRPGPEEYSGPEEVKYVRFKFGGHAKDDGCAVYQLFAYARGKAKKEQVEPFPALCSDGRHLIFLHAGSVKSSNSAEKELILQTFIGDAARMSQGRPFTSEYRVDLQWGLHETRLTMCSFACNSKKLLVGHRRNFDIRKSDEKSADFSFRLFDLSSGKQIQFSEASFAKVSPRQPNRLYHLNYLLTF